MKLSILLLLFSATTAISQDAQWVNSLADCIKVHENSIKYPYGIKSIKITGITQKEREAKARSICVKTIQNNIQRWTLAGKTNSFVDFLANRYTPMSCDFQGNLNWKADIRKLLKAKNQPIF